MFAVEVVGLGVVGSYIAWRLAEKGWRVVGRDVSERPWEAVCGGLVSAETVRENPFMEPHVLLTVNGARIHAGRETLEVLRPRVAYVLDRAALHRELIERAGSAGAEVRLGERGPKRDAAVLIGADGVLSTVRRSLGLGTPAYVMGAQVEVRGRFDDLVDVYFLPNIDFFAWIIPLDEKHARAGLATRGDPVPPLRAFLRRLRLRRAGEIRGRPIPVDTPLRRVVFGTTALVGDAVPHTKATTGGGIRYGLLAARALVEATHRFFSTGILSPYQSFHTRYLYPRLSLHYLLRRWFGRITEETLRRAKDAGLADVLSRFGSMDDPFFVLNPRVWWAIARTFSPGAHIPRKPRRSRRRSSRARASGKK